MGALGIVNLVDRPHGRERLILTITQAEALTIPTHIHGYPDVAFGGYLAGLLAAHAGGDTVRVDFRRAVSVDTPILLSAPEPGRATFTATDDTLLVEAAPATLTLDPRPAPSWAAAKSAVELGLSGKRTVTDCYGCGLACAPGRGLVLFPSELPGERMMAAAWTPTQRSPTRPASCRPRWCGRHSTVPAAEPPSCSPAWAWARSPPLSPQPSCNPCTPEPTTSPTPGSPTATAANTPSAWHFPPPTATRSHWPRPCGSSRETDRVARSSSPKAQADATAAVIDEPTPSS